MKKQLFIVVLALLYLMQLHSQVQKPNIILIYTDDHGYADLSCQGIVDDIKTPNIDILAANGVRALNGYCTAPQCIPSRGGIMVGKSQNRFGLESNASELDGFNAEITIADRLKQAGYVTAQFGKWHLGATASITDHGFDHVFAQNANRPFNANITHKGSDRPMGELNNKMYHIDGCSYAASNIIKRYSDKPFFLYVAYRAPHVPLDAPAKYLSRFPGEMPERRRQALAMISAMDDGVGLITQTLKNEGIFENTLIFIIGDNGAPLKMHKEDLPGGGPGWDGSLNDPMNGEKGMLTEGGIHVPFVISWEGKIPGGQEYAHPVYTLDVAATAAALAGIEVNPGELDGVNLIPYLTGENESPPHDALMWRWVAQSAIRAGNWKLLRGGTREYLFDLDKDIEEDHNLAAEFPEVADSLRTILANWTNELDPPGLATGDMAVTWHTYYDFYLEGGKYDTICYHEWHFDSLTNWELNDRLTGSVVNSVAQLSIDGVDPFMNFTKKVCIDTDKLKYLKVSAKNNTNGANAALYFVNDVTNTFKYQEIGMSQNDDQLKDYVIDLSSNPDWTGNITRIRLDPPGTAGSFDIDYLVLSENNYPVGMVADEKNQEILLYPNPAKDYINLVTGRPSSVEIFDLHGRLVFQSNYKLNNRKINVQNLEKGIYFIKSQNEFGTDFRKILVK